jgi:hypothetical protein
MDLGSVHVGLDALGVDKPSHYVVSRAAQITSSLRSSSIASSMLPGSVPMPRVSLSDGPSRRCFGLRAGRNEPVLNTVQAGDKGNR